MMTIVESCVLVAEVANNPLYWASVELSHLESVARLGVYNKPDTPSS